MSRRKSFFILIMTLAISTVAFGQDESCQWHSSLARAFGVGGGEGYHQCRPGSIRYGHERSQMQPSLAVPAQPFVGDFLPSDYLPMPTPIEPTLMEPRSISKPEIEKTPSRVRQEPEPEETALPDPESVPSPSDITPPVDREDDDDLLLPSPQSDQTSNRSIVIPNGETLLNSANWRMRRPTAVSTTTVVSPIVQPNHLRTASRIKEPQTKERPARR